LGKGLLFSGRIHVFLSLGPIRYRAFHFAFAVILRRDPEIYLFIDTETTGVTPRDRIVSICCAFYDSRGNNTSSMYALIKPEGFSIPSQATAIHGITTERAMREGFTLASTLATMNAELRHRSPKILVGHNFDFDRSMILREYGRLHRVEQLSAMKAFCTMRGTATICRLPGKYGDYKWPKLDELHRHLFGKGLGDAHNARADVEACARCFFELLKRGMRLEWPEDDGQ
jgi:DNA polymerase-3 subunit epsilon